MTTAQITGIPRSRRGNWGVWSESLCVQGARCVRQRRRSRVANSCAAAAPALLLLSCCSSRARQRAANSRPPFHAHARHPGIKIAPALVRGSCNRSRYRPVSERGETRRDNLSEVTDQNDDTLFNLRGAECGKLGLINISRSLTPRRAGADKAVSGPANSVAVQDLILGLVTRSANDAAACSPRD